jgi:hypothetical protein
MAQQQAGFDAVNAASAVGYGYIDDATQHLTQAERRRGRIQRQLGGDVQQYGQYMGTYSAGRGLSGRQARKFAKGAGVDLGPAGKGRKARKARQQAADQYWQDTSSAAITSANDLMAQSLAAAQAGDTALADDLRAQADAAVSGLPQMKGGGIKQGQVARGKKGWRGKGIKFDDPSANLDKAVTSPTGMIAGGLVRDARGLLDPDSQQTADFIGSLTDAPLAEIDAGRTSALRSLAAGERTAMRQQRDFGLQRGGVRSATAEAAMGSARAQQFAGRRAGVELETSVGRAKVIGEARKTYEIFKRDFAGNVLETADAWTNRRSGINFETLGMRVSLAQSAAGLAGATASAIGGVAQAGIGAGASMANTAANNAQANQAAQMDLFAGIAGAALGAVAAYAGTPATTTPPTTTPPPPAPDTNAGYMGPGGFTF